MVPKLFNFDLPRVVQTAPQYPGIQHVGGNMFDSIPNGEVIMTKSTCHNWNDENVVIMLRNIYRALPSGGKLIIISVVKPEEPNTTKLSQYVAVLDMKMLALIAGKQRSVKEFKALTEASHFKNFRVACMAHSIWAVMEAFK